MLLHPHVLSSKNLKSQFFLKHHEKQTKNSNNAANYKKKKYEHFLK